MTNEVEGLILDKYGKKEEINYSKQVAYKFYKIIWKYILSNEDYGYSYININFKTEFFDNKYYIKNNNCGYCQVITDEDFVYKMNSLTYFNSCEEFVKNILNTNIDFDLFLDLITSDEFVYSLSRDNEEIWVNIIIKKDIVEKVVAGILTKHKVLKREI